MEKKYKYDVALSFAEEDRNAALALSLALEMEGFKNVYYYPDRPEVVWGHQLEQKLEQLYGEEAMYVVVLLSAKYFKKKFAQVELNAVLKRMETGPGVCMLPVLLNRFKKPSHPWLFGSGYLRWRYDPKDIATTLKKVLGNDRTEMYKNVPESLMDIILFKGNRVFVKDIDVGRRQEAGANARASKKIIEDNTFRGDTITF